MDGEAEFVEVLNLELCFHELLGDLKHALEVLSPHVCGQVEEVIWLHLASFNGGDFDSAVAVVESWDLINSCVVSLSVLTFRLPVIVILLNLVHLGRSGLGLLVLTVGQSLALCKLNHLEDLGWVGLQLCCLSGHRLACLGWLSLLLIISGGVLFLDEVVVELLEENVSALALVGVLGGHV